VVAGLEVLDPELDGPAQKGQSSPAVGRSTLSRGPVSFMQP